MSSGAWRTLAAATTTGGSARRSSWPSQAPRPRPTESRSSNTMPQRLSSSAAATACHSSPASTGYSPSPTFATHSSNSGSADTTNTPRLGGAGASGGVSATGPACGSEGAAGSAAGWRSGSAACSAGCSAACSALGPAAVATGGPASGSGSGSGTANGSGSSTPVGSSSASSRRPGSSSCIGTPTSAHRSGVSATAPEQGPGRRRASRQRNCKHHCTSLLPRRGLAATPAIVKLTDRPWPKMRNRSQISRVSTDCSRSGQALGGPVPAAAGTGPGLRTRRSAEGTRTAPAGRAWRRPCRSASRTGRSAGPCRRRCSVPA
jgi:hypothetical protein